MSLLLLVAETIKPTVPVRGSVAAGNYETFSFSITDSPQSWSYFKRNLPCEIRRKKAVISPSFLARHSNHKSTILINTSNWQSRSHGHTTFIIILWLHSYYAHQNNQMWLWWGWRNNWMQPELINFREFSPNTRE